MPINTQKAKEQAELYAYARDHGHLNFIQKADLCSSFFAGDQWEKSLADKLRRMGKPALTINKIIATITAVMGEQLETRADISFLPAGTGDPQTAEALTKTYIQIANSNHFDRLESQVFDNGIITSRGFFDVRLSFDDNLRGEVRLGRHNPRNVLLDPDAEDYDPDKWNRVLITKWLTADDVALLYSEEDAKLLRQRSKSTLAYGQDFIDRPGTFGGPSREFDEGAHVPSHYRVIEHQYRVKKRLPHFIDPVTGDSRPIPQDWSRERIQRVIQLSDLIVLDRMTQIIRWTVSCDDVILFDEDSPYKHFTVVPFFPYFHDGYTIGLVENLVSPQEYLNKVSSQELHIVNTTANSGWKLKSGSLQGMTREELEERGAETGLVLELMDVKDAEKIQPNQVPTGLDRFGFKMDENIKQISGVSDSTRGFDRADVAAKAIKAKQAAGSVNISKIFENLNWTRHMVAKRILDLVQVYYTEERVIRVAGTFNRDPEEITINQTTPEGEIINDLTLGEYQIAVATVPARETFEESQFEQAVQLRELGVHIPDEVLIENSRLAKKHEIIKALQGDSDEDQQRQQQLEQQLQEVELQAKQADAMLKQANAELAMARAEATRLEAQQGDGQGAELALKQQEIEGKLQIQREAAQAKIQLEREKNRLQHLRELAVNAEKLEIERKRPAPAQRK